MNNKLISNNLISLDQVDSTNDYARMILRNNRVPEGTVILADEQLKGKGQPGNSWESEKGKNITMSIILYPKKLQLNKHFFLAMATSLSITSCLKDLEIETRIKWPNDIYHGQKKIAGILIENSIQQNTITESVIGIGININQIKFSSALSNPTSVRQITGRYTDITEICRILIYNLNRWLGKLYAGYLKEIRSKYMDNLLLLDQPAIFGINNSKRKATIIDVEDDGTLVLRMAGGSIQKFFFKEIEFPL